MYNDDEVNQNKIDCHSEAQLKSDVEKDVYSESPKKEQSHEMLNVVISRKNTQSLLTASGTLFRTVRANSHLRLICQHDEIVLLKNEHHSENNDNTSPLPLSSKEREEVVGEFMSHTNSGEVKNKFGFTLAEVLITLAILGVVAAISIPNIVQNYQRRVTITKIKKYYAKLTEAFELYKIENPDAKCPNNSTELFNTFIQPYFKVSYDAGLDNREKQPKILPSDKYKFLNGNEWTELIHYQWYASKLADGSVFVSRPATNSEGSNGSCGSIYIDVNGKAGPNQFGKDLFIFNLNQEDKSIYDISPFWAYKKENSQDYKVACEDNCINNSSSGNACAAWIIAKGNMKYLDCPRGIDFDTEQCK